MNEFDLQFKIFIQVDTTKSYVILNESINKSVSESIILMGYKLSKTNFNDRNRQICMYMLRDHISKKSQKTNIQRSSNRTKLFDGYK